MFSENIFELPKKDGNVTPTKAHNRDECSFVTKQHMFGVFTIDAFLRCRGSPFSASRTLCHPVLDQICQTKPCSRQTLLSDKQRIICIETQWTKCLRDS